MSKRVLVLNHFAVPRDQPGGTRHIELFSRLDGWDFTIIAARRNLTNGRNQPDTPGFRFVPVTPYSGNGIARVVNWISFAVTAFVAGLRTPRPAVVYASSPHLLAGFCGWTLAKVRRARFVLEIRDLWPKTLADMGAVAETSLVYRALRQLELFMYRRADAIVGMAQGTVAAITADGIPAEKIAYLPNASDPEDFAPSTDRDSLRDRYNFTRLTGVYAGAHGPANGLNLLLDAMQEIGDIGIDVVLVGDGAEKDALKRQAAKHGLSHVRFHDPVPKAEMPDILAAADFGIHVLADVELFRSAVSPNKVFDYLAAGKPVVTNCPGVVGDMVEDAGAGFVCEPNKLSSGLREISELDEAARGELGRHGVQWVVDHQSRSSVARELGGVLSGSVSRGGHLTP
jgi:glycosyltransferase involved in cell wall biosynthesis